MSDIAFQVRQMIARHVDPLVMKPGSPIEGAADLRTSLRIVPLDVVEIVMAAEEEFGIAIFDQEISATRTVDDLVMLVRVKVGMKDEHA